jgi:hypothetical protein
MHHDDTFPAIMNTFYGGLFSGFGSAFLFADDINGIQSLYGTGLGYVLTDADHLGSAARAAQTRSPSITTAAPMSWS